jgi:alkylhydroperoxidase family enzyme
MARVRQLGPDDWPADHRRVLEELIAARGFVPSIYAAMAHVPDLMAAFIHFTSKLRGDGALDGADKELAILLVGHLAEARTIVDAHRGFALAAGVPADRIESVAAWRTAGIFDDRTRAILAYVEAVTIGIRVDDDVWKIVEAHLSEPQLVELTLVAGCYSMVARFLEPLQVDRDPRY